MLLTILAVVLAFILGVAIGHESLKNSLLKDGYLVYRGKGNKVGQDMYRVLIMGEGEKTDGKP